nr:hypothetical protein [Roseomonas sp. SXEYE001]
MTRQAKLLAVPGNPSTRFPGDGGSRLVNGAGRADWAAARQARSVWAREDQ